MGGKEGGRERGKEGGRERFRDCEWQKLRTMDQTEGVEIRNERKLRK